jgi:Ca2+-binding RTX toxin-like protein
LFINANTVIENAFGGDSDDAIIGNATANDIEGMRGNDSIDGGAGIDTAQFSGLSTSYVRSVASTVKTVTDNVANRDGTDTLANIERLHFSDTNIALDVGPNQNAGSVYMLYKAAFNRAPDASGMGYWLAQKDGGSNIVTNIAQGFVNAPEFVAKYGTNPSNAAYVDKLYQNVLDRPGESGGVTYWNQELDAGRISKAAVLVQFATLPEGAANVASLIANGIPYTEYVG